MYCVVVTSLVLLMLCLLHNLFQLCFFTVCLVCGLYVAFMRMVAVGCCCFGRLVVCWWSVGCLLVVGRLFRGARARDKGKDKGRGQEPEQGLGIVPQTRASYMFVLVRVVVFMVLRFWFI